MRSDKFDAYLLAELPAIEQVGMDRIPIGFRVSADSRKAFNEARLEVEDLFRSGTPSRLTTAHWPSLVGRYHAYLTAEVDRALLDRLAASSSVYEIQLCADPVNRRPLVPRRNAPNTSPPGAVAPIPPTGKGRKKILALVDHGCPFAHRQLLGQRGQSRIYAIWDQDPVPDFPPEKGTIPEGFGYGRQISSEVLNDWVTEATDTRDGRAVVDEARCYALAQYSAMRQRASHGSVVLGLLAADRLMGTSEGVQAAHVPVDEEVSLIFVQLPRSVPQATTRGSVERCMLDGVRYILNCAGQNADVSVVLDYGSELGPHDASSWFERAIDALVAEAEEAPNNVKLIPVFCSGNSYQESRNLVVRPSAVEAGGPARVTFGWHVPRGNDTAAAMEIWTRSFEGGWVAIRPPGGEAIRVNVNFATLPPRDGAAWRWPTGRNPIDAGWTLVCKRVGDQIQFLCQVAPTRMTLDEVAGVPGCWQIEVGWSGNHVGDLHVYSRFGGKNIGFAQRTWPARFSARPLDLATGRIVLSGTGSTWGSACGTKVQVAGGYEGWGALRRASYSSAGPTRDSNASPRVKPDVLAVTEEFPSARGILGIGHRSSVLLRARGTSFAAPQLARSQILVFPSSVPDSKPAPPPERGFVKARDSEDPKPRLAGPASD